MWSLNIRIHAIYIHIALSSVGLSCNLTSLNNVSHSVLSSPRLNASFEETKTHWNSTLYQDPNWVVEHSPALLSGCSSSMPSHNAIPNVSVHFDTLRNINITLSQCNRSPVDTADLLCLPSANYNFEQCERTPAIHQLRSTVVARPTAFDQQIYITVLSSPRLSNAYSYKHYYGMLS